jgi:hypothetical protein
MIHTVWPLVKNTSCVEKVAAVAITKGIVGRILKQYRDRMLT